MYIKNNILMMFKQVLFDEFDSMLLSSLKHSNVNFKIVHLKINVYCLFLGFFCLVVPELGFHWS